MSTPLPTHSLAVSKPTSRRSPARAIVVIAMLMLGTAMAGCGGSSKSHSTATAAAATTAAITRAEFVAKANAICASADPALAEASAKLASRPSNAKLAALVKGTYIPLINTQITQISALGAPPADRAAVGKMLGMVQADLRKLESRPALVATDVFGNFARVAHPYGLTACAPTS